MLCSSQEPARRAECRAYLAESSLLGSPWGHVGQTGVTPSPLLPWPGAGLPPRSMSPGCCVWAQDPSAIWALCVYRSSLLARVCRRCPGAFVSARRACASRGPWAGGGGGTWVGRGGGPQRTWDRREGGPEGRITEEGDEGRNQSRARRERRQSRAVRSCGGLLLGKRGLRVQLVPDVPRACWAVPQAIQSRCFPGHPL